MVPPRPRPRWRTPIPFRKSDLKAASSTTRSRRQGEGQAGGAERLAIPILSTLQGPWQWRRGMQVAHEEVGGGARARDL